MDYYVVLAKQAVEKYVTEREILTVPENLPAEFFSRRAGVFVTLHKDGELCGCIGTYLPTRKNIAEEIVRNAVAACSEDYRFSSVVPKDLPRLDYEVSLLAEPREARDLKKHDPKKQGILVWASDGRVGLLLPDIEGIDTTEEQVSIACRKGGIDSRSKNIRILEFTVKKHR